MSRIERVAFGFFVALLILLLMAVATALQGCSALHPSDRTPDADWIDGNGHKYYGWRVGKTGSVAHAGDCPHPSHIKMHPDTVYTNQVTQGVK